MGAAAVGGAAAVAGAAGAWGLGKVGPPPRGCAPLPTTVLGPPRLRVVSKLSTLAWISALNAGSATRVYTPGKFGWAQPRPQLTRPTSLYPPPSSGACIGPPLSPKQPSTPPSA